MDDLTLLPWEDGDLALLRAGNTPEQKAKLGGPETDEQVLKRHARYLTSNRAGESRMLKIVWQGISVGSLGYWEREWAGDTVYEIGWEVLPAYHRRGIGSAATRQLITLLRNEAERRWVHAYPSVDNPGSNAICRAAGLELVGPCTVEFPPGHWMDCNDWRRDLMV